MRYSFLIGNKVMKMDEDLSAIHTDATQALPHWLNSVVGQYVQAQEQVLYDQAVVDLFGFNALQMGCFGTNLLRNSRIANRYIASDRVEESCDLYCSDEFLPFPEMSLDVLLLPHRLEFSARPHQTLREAARVMMPEGYLLISGFNPLSSWGLWSAFKRHCSHHKSDPWQGKWIGLARLKDWLALLGFEVVSVSMCCHVPPFESTTWHQRFSWTDKRNYMPKLGGVYFIVAKKRVVSMTPIKPKWKTRLGTGVIVNRQPSRKSQPTASRKVK